LNWSCSSFCRVYYLIFAQTHPCIHTFFIDIYFCFQTFTLSMFILQRHSWAILEAGMESYLDLGKIPCIMLCGLDRLCCAKGNILSASLFSELFEFTPNLKSSYVFVMLCTYIEFCCLYKFLSVLQKMWVRGCLYSPTKMIPLELLQGPQKKTWSEQPFNEQKYWFLCAYLRDNRRFLFFLYKIIHHCSVTFA